MSEVSTEQVTESTDDAVEAGNGYTAVFYRADYRRAAEMIQRARGARGSGDPKNDAAQQVIKSLVDAVSAVFAADAAMAGRVEGDKHHFDAETFENGTLLYSQRHPESADTDSDDGDEDDEDGYDEDDDL